MHKRVALVAAAVFGALLPLFVAAPAHALGRIQIVRIRYAQIGTDLNTEYIVFKNITTKAVQMKGWEIISAPSSDNQHYFFPYTYVPAGSTVTLYTGRGTNSPGKRYWGATGPRWDNDGDKAILISSWGTTIDTCQYIGGGTTAYC